VNYEELANILFKDVNDIAYYKEKYPNRNLKEGSMVTRFAPSPTGHIHLGSLFSAFISETFAKQTNGIFYVRIEDTDQKREVENGTQGILNDLEEWQFKIDEDPIKGGLYGPYIQSQRKDIYLAFAKYFVQIGKAYPCFLTANELDEIREKQEKNKERIGYYGKYAVSRNLSLEEIKANIANHLPYVLRLKTSGNFENKHIYHDLVKGDVNITENDLDIVLLKSDLMPTYNFAHLVDDYLMGTTHVIRGDEWLSTLPVHLELFKTLGVEAPKYAHIATLNKKDGMSERKISKRYDPEAMIKYYAEEGILSETVKLYLCTLFNSNFEEWYLANNDKSYSDFTFTFDKMSKSGSLFDLEKLENIAKVYFSKLSSKVIYDKLLTYTLNYDLAFYELIKDKKDYLIKLLNIERLGDRPRMDIAKLKDVKEEFWYMFDSLFDKSKYQDIHFNYDVKFILNYFKDVFDENDTEEVWFNKVKEAANLNNFAINRRDYKENPDKYLGNIADFCSIIRKIVTTKDISPNLYDLLIILGKERLIKRTEMFLEML
jgi:glutamyl-tRNA synthetase